MGSKRPDRRELLKSGAALAGGLTLGAVAPASGQTPASTPFIKGSKGAHRLWRTLPFRDLRPRTSRREAFAGCVRARFSCDDPAAGLRSE
jgi:hypothetical protein